MDVRDLNGYGFEELSVGMSAVYSRTITDTDLRNFAGVSGDTNPMHLNEEYAKTTAFNGCILHGLLTASLLSTVIGTKLPGPGCLYVNQTLNFKAPVYVGDTVYAKATVTELMPSGAAPGLRPCAKSMDGSCLTARRSCNCRGNRKTWRRSRRASKPPRHRSLPAYSTAS